MNLSSIVLACTTLGLGTAAVYLYTELDAERARADAEAALRQDQEARVHALEARLNPPPRAMTGEMGLAPQQTGGIPPPRNISQGNSRPGEVQAAADGTGSRMFGNMRSALREMLNTPEGHQMMLNRQKMGLRAQYKDLAKELNLPADQADKLITLLAEQQVRQIERFQQAEGRAALNQANTEAQRQNETELMTLLGDKYLQYESYQKSLGERMQLEQMNVQFEATNLPLNDSQKKQLLSAMVQEREAAPRPTWTEGSSMEDFAQQQRAWQQDYNKRIQARASSVLTPQQLKQFEELQQSQTSIAMPMVGPGGRFNGAVMRGVRPPRQQ